MHYLEILQIILDTIIAEARRITGGLPFDEVDVNKQSVLTVLADNNINKEVAERWMAYLHTQNCIWLSPQQPEKIKLLNTGIANGLSGLYTVQNIERIHNEEKVDAELRGINSTRIGVWTTIVFSLIVTFIQIKGCIKEQEKDTSRNISVQQQPTQKPK
jgi:hypothetical protein